MTIDISRPPFSLGTGDAATVGAQMASVYEGFEANPPLVADIWQASIASLGLRNTSPVIRAGAALAAALDRGEGTGIPGYHNTPHYLEVLCNTVQLIQRTEAMGEWSFTPEEKAKMIFAALAHDFHYEAGGNFGPDGQLVPFRLEKISSDAAEEFLVAAGVSRADRADIATMILCTDVSPASKAGDFLRDVYNHIFGRTPGAPPIATPEQKEVSRLPQNPRLVQMAAILSDADVLSSAALTFDYSSKLTGKLEIEWGKVTDLKTLVGFLTHVVKDKFLSPGAQFFAPNMAATKQKAQQLIDAGTPERPTQKAGNPADSKPNGSG